MKSNELWATQQLKSLKRITNYAKFLKQPLTLGMFVPCDEDGNVLEEFDSIGIGNEFYLLRALEQYDSAKESVLFEGFELSYNSSFTLIAENENLNLEVKFDKKGDTERMTFKTIEDLSKYPVELTQSAIKALFK